jgi:hypothetical protein
VGVTYVFGIFFSRWVFYNPPEMTSQINGTTLVWFFEQLAPVQGRFRDQGVVILLGESSRSVKSTGNDTHCLELCPRVADCIFVNCECLGKELVADFLESRLIGNLATHHEEAQGEFCTSWVVYSLVKVTNTLVHKSVQR